MQIVTALNKVSFSVERGEFVSIVGQSGSGKSTLLHIIGGVDKPTSGKIIMDGKEVLQKSQEELAIYRRRQVGLIYQFYNLIPVLNVEENIVLPLKLDGQKINQERVDELIDALGLTDRRKHLPKQLSGGQQQRVSIGRAIIHAPALVVADEPTGNFFCIFRIFSLLYKSGKIRFSFFCRNQFLFFLFLRLADKNHENFILRETKKDFMSICPERV